MMPSIVIINDPASGISDADLPLIASSLQLQQIHDVEPEWSVAATVRFATEKDPATRFEWPLYLLEHPDQAGAYGYHDWTADGMPLLKVFPKLDLADGHDPSVTMSHEIIETVIDPWLGRCSFSTQLGDNRVIWATEACDAVERDFYLINGVAVSNFVYPSYFETPRNATKFDHMGLLKSPLEIREGGYGQWFDGTTGWNQIDKNQRRGRASLRGRAARRRERLESLAGRV